MTAYYNENEPYCVEWLKSLIDKGLIAPGDVDNKDIRDVRPIDLRGYDQCHFFAGIGGWSYALRLAAWPDNREVWTGSCPCQPFSQAGQGGGFADERHLWPYWHYLVEQCRPSVVFGEQVASKAGLSWFDLVQTDLENTGYAVGSADLCAASVGAPHIRQRLWFVAESLRESSKRRAGSVLGTQAALDSAREFDGREPDGPANGRQDSLVADANGRDASAEGLQRGGEHGQRPEDGRAMQLAHSAGRGLREFGDAPQSGNGGHADGGFVSGGMGHAEDANGRTGERDTQAGIGTDGERRGRPTSASLDGGMAYTERNGGRPDFPQRQAQGREANGWASAQWLPCTDGKARPVEPGTFPLAHGIPKRTSKLRAYGNAIVPQVAAEFIRAYRD